jgi:hypothetical protein
MIIEDYKGNQQFFPLQRIFHQAMKQILREVGLMCRRKLLMLPLFHCEYGVQFYDELRISLRFFIFPRYIQEVHLVS